jgi:uncharacterized phiE125 gp8 family phage protein
MTLVRITPPATEPVTLQEAKIHLRVDDTEEDTSISMAIQAAREEAEHQTGRALITQTWERVLDAFPAGAIQLGNPPIISITSVKYFDVNGVEQTLSASAYTLDSVKMPGWLLPSAAYPTWPSTQADTPNTVRVRFTCGYGAASAVPAKVRRWILLRIGTLHEHRQESVIGVSITPLPRDYTDRLLDPVRIWAS